MDREKDSGSDPVPLPSPAADVAPLPTTPPDAVPATARRTLGRKAVLTAKMSSSGAQFVTEVRNGGSGLSASREASYMMSSVAEVSCSPGAILTLSS